MSPAPRPTLRARTPKLAFDEVPRHWFAGNLVATHLSNAVNLLFPAGERFFVRSVHHYADHLTDEALRDQVRGFCAQEGRHAQAHERFFATLRAQGYRIDGFLRVFETVCFRGIEPAATPALRLAVTAAVEHFTAMLAHDALSRNFLSIAHPTMHRLLSWHAAEEIEHKSVAFDVLAQVAPGHARRVAGLAVATGLLASFWMAAFVMLLAQDPDTSLRRIVDDVRRIREHRGDRTLSRDVFLAGILEYAARDFHPDDLDDRALAARWLADAGMAEAA